MRYECNYGSCNAYLRNYWLSPSPSLIMTTNRSTLKSTRFNSCSASKTRITCAITTQENGQSQRPERNIKKWHILVKTEYFRAEKMIETEKYISSLAAIDFPGAEKWYTAAYASQTRGNLCYDRFNFNFISLLTYFILRKLLETIY